MEVIRWPINKTKVVFLNARPPLPMIPDTQIPFRFRGKRDVFSPAQPLQPLPPHGFVYIHLLFFLPTTAERTREGKRHTQDSLLGQFFLYRKQTVVFIQPLATTQTSQFDVVCAYSYSLRKGTRMQTER